MSNDKQGIAKKIVSKDKDNGVKEVKMKWMIEVVFNSNVGGVPLFGGACGDCESLAVE